MKAELYDKTGSKIGEIDLPPQFEEDVRPDVIKKAFLAIFKAKLQPYGARRKAGRTSSAIFRSIRRGYGHSYGWGIARIPRLMIRGGRRVGRAVNVPQAVGGPRAHPPKVEKVWAININKKERLLAIRSALAASAMHYYVTNRGHKIEEGRLLPFVVEGLEEIEKTKDAMNLLLALGLQEELERASRKKIRAGKGKMRGRKYKKAKGPLVIISEHNPKVYKAFRNIPGVDVVEVRNLNVELLAPGAHPGRLVIISKKALEKLEKEKLFF